MAIPLAFMAQRGQEWPLLAVNNQYQHQREDKWPSRCSGNLLKVYWILLGDRFLNMDVVSMYVMKSETLLIRSLEIPIGY